MRSAIGLMAKAPIAGQVKTRLCPPLQPEAARQAAIGMLHDAAEQARATGADLWCVHTGDPALLAPHLPEGAALLSQRGEGLAERLAAAQQDLHAAGYDRVLLVGGDCPTADAAYLSTGLASLTHHDVVLGPSVDGGYTLVGSSRPTPTLFDVTMSTTRVLQHTVARAERDGMTIHLLDRRGDLDTVDDLIGALDSGWLATAPLTAALAAQLAEHHRLSSPGLEAP